MDEIEQISRINDYTKQQRLMAYAVMIVLLGGMVWLARDLVRLGLDCDCWWLRWPSFTIAGLLSIVSLRWMAILVRRKIKTGAFLRSRQENLARAAAMRAKMGAGKPWGPQAWLWSVTFGLMAFFLAASVAAVALAMHFGPASGAMFWLGLLLAAACLLIPGIFLFKSFSRWRKTGYFLPTEEELAAARAKCGTPQPLKTRVFLAVVYVFVAAVYLDTAIGRHRHSTNAWILASIWGSLAIFYIVQVFRPAKPQCVVPSNLTSLNLDSPEAK